MASSLFSYGDVRNHPARSGFDLSKRICFTSKAGELLPVYRRIVFPGDKFEINTQLFTRTQPLNTAAFTRLREYLDFYFVPLRLINKNLPQALMKMNDNPVQAESLVKNRLVTSDIPYTISGTSMSSDDSPSYDNLTDLLALFSGDDRISDEVVKLGVKNFLGFNVGSTSAKLVQYLGLGNFSNFNRKFNFTSSPNFNFDTGLRSFAFNVLYFAAYQKIYADHFRNSQWESNEPYTYNFDYYSGGNIFFDLTTSKDSISVSSPAWKFATNNNLFTLRYSNWPKDIFMGIVPNSQLGEVSVVESHQDKTLSLGYTSATKSGQRFYPNFYAISKSSDVDDSKFFNNISNYNANWSPVSGNDTMKLAVDLSNYSPSFDVLQLRMAEAVQRYREVAQVAKQTARDQIYAHFGVSISPALSDECYRLGGSVSNLDISEVVNQNLSETNQATISGKGVGSGVCHLKCSFDEYGILMGIYHVVPLLDYVLTGNPKDFLYTNVDDLPFPEFDSIGLESLYFQNFLNSNIGYSSFIPEFFTSVMGYVPRFYDLKTDFDQVFGAFTTTLKDWVAPVSLDTLRDYIESSYNSVSDKFSFSINYGFFKVNPHVLDSIFTVKSDSSVDTDQFLTALYFDIKAVRNFDYDGMPY